MTLEHPPATHPAAGLDDVVHQRNRLGILTVVAEAEEAEFGFLQEVLGLTAGNLNRHLAVLSEAGLVAVRKKETRGGRPKTWVRISEAGRQALAREMSALEELLRRHRGARPDPPPQQG
jgi:DNA-binding MarR family transcriptional regulator